MRRKSRATRDLRPAPAATRGAGGGGRPIERWQPGLVVLAVATLSVLLAAPRAVEPDALPRPSVDPRALADIAARDAHAARAAHATPLDAEVRTLGSALRTFGRAEALGDETEIVRAREALLEAAMRARAQGEEQIAALRALQLDLFLAEVQKWERSGEVSTALAELGGGFLRHLERNGWARGGRVAMPPAALRAAWKRRFTELTGLTGGALEVPRAERLALLDFLLLSPVAPPPEHAANARAYQDRFRLRKIDEIAELDPRYPRELARGVLQYRLGRPADAAASFRAFLAGAPPRALAVAAENHLRAATRRALDASP